MDQKTWLWRKRSLEKTTITSGGEEVQAIAIPSEKEAYLENSLKSLNEKLTSVLDECSAKDELLLNYETAAEDALADKEKAEEEILLLKQELDETLRQKMAANERLIHLNSALKENMQQLNLVHEEQEQRVQNAITNTTKEFERAHKKLEEKIQNLTVENSYLTKAILIKDKSIEDLNNLKCQTEAEFEALMSRLNSVEKENVFLRYEFHSLERELDLRNEELESSYRSTEASVKKMKKLEAECQRLRVMTRKRLPSPAILANIKSDIEIQGRNHIVPGRTRNPFAGGSNATKNHVRDLEKENEILKECLAKKEEEMSCLQKAKNSVPDELSLTTGYGVVDSNEITCSHSWASEMSLMDDFVEMEKLAVVAIDPPVGGSVGKEIVLLGNNDLNTENKNPREWINGVAEVIFKQHNISKRILDELLGDVRIVLNNMICSEPSKLPYITWKSPTIRDEFVKHLGGAGPGTAFKLESVQNLMFEIEKIFSTSQVEIEGLKNDLDSTKQDNEALINKLEESRQSIVSLQNELEILKESKKITEDQVENQKHINEDLDTQLSVTKVKLNEVLQKLSCVEVELDDRSHCCEELEGTCVDRQLQLDSITSNRYPDCEQKQEKLLQTFAIRGDISETIKTSSVICDIMKELKGGLEITEASARLAECEESIFKLGNQLKSLGSVKELAIVDKFLCVRNNEDKKFKQRPSLRDQMLSEDRSVSEIIETNDFSSKKSKAGSLVIVSSKRGGGRMGFLMKLLVSKKKGVPFFGK